MATTIPTSGNISLNIKTLDPAMMSSSATQPIYIYFTDPATGKKYYYYAPTGARGQEIVDALKEYGITNIGSQLAKSPTEYAKSSGFLAPRSAYNSGQGTAFDDAAYQAALKSWGASNAPQYVDLPSWGEDITNRIVPTTTGKVQMDPLPQEQIDYWNAVNSGLNPSPPTTPTPQVSASLGETTPTQQTPTSTYTGASIVDYLKSIGQPSDYTSRATLAAQKGITNYTGTAEQNTQLLNALRGAGTAGGTTPTGGSYINEITQQSFPIGTPSQGYNADGTKIGTTGGANIGTGGGTSGTLTPAQQIQQQITGVQGSITDLQKQQQALQQYGLTDTNQLTIDASGNYVPMGEVSATGDSVLDEILTSIQTYLDKLTQQGKTINPYVDITPEKVAEFLKQAETEIDPYYTTQLKLAREGILTALNYSKEDIVRFEQDLEKTYGKSLRVLGEGMAEKGFALSGQRQLEEQDLAYQTQRQIEEQRRQLAYGAGQAARTFAQEWGKPTFETPTMGTMPTVMPGERTFATTGGTMPVYELSSDIYDQLVGSKQYEQTAAKLTRQAQLESAFKESELSKRYLSLV